MNDEPDVDTVRPFTIDIEQEILDDLLARLDNVRWPDETDGAGWAYGTDLAYASFAATGATASTGANKKLG